MAENASKFTGNVEFSAEDILALVKFFRIELTKQEAEAIFRSPEVQAKLAQELVATQEGFRNELKRFVMWETSFSDKILRFD